MAVQCNAGRCRFPPPPRFLSSPFHLVSNPEYLSDRGIGKCPFLRFRNGLHYPDRLISAVMITLFLEFLNEHMPLVWKVVCSREETHDLIDLITQLYVLRF